MHNKSNGRRDTQLARDLESDAFLLCLILGVSFSLRIRLQLLLKTMSGSETSERVSLIFTACLAGGNSKSSGLWFFELSRMPDLKNLPRFLKML